MGKWPGNETDEELLQALAEMDGKLVREGRHPPYPERPIHWMDVVDPDRRLPALVFETEEEYQRAVGLLNDTEDPERRWSTVAVTMTAEEWNHAHEPGTKVRYYPVAGETEHIETMTRSRAWTLGNGEAVVAVDGRPGGVSLRHLLPGWGPVERQ